MITYTLKTR